MEKQVSSCNHKIKICYNPCHCPGKRTNTNQTSPTKTPTKPNTSTKAMTDVETELSQNNEACDGLDLHQEAAAPVGPLQILALPKSTPTKIPTETPTEINIPSPSLPPLKRTKSTQPSNYQPPTVQDFTSSPVSAEAENSVRLHAEGSGEGN